MKLKLAIISTVFPILALGLFPVSSWANPTPNDLMQECIKSPKHLIHPKGDIYYACGSVSRVDDKSLALEAADNQARRKFAQAILQGTGKHGMVLRNVNITNHWPIITEYAPGSPLWALAQYKPTAAEKKKLDDSIARPTPNPANSGMGNEGRQALNQKVAGSAAMGSARQAAKSTAAQGTPTPPPTKGMGNLATQTQGQANASGGTPTTPSAPPSSGKSQTSNQNPFTQDVNKPVAAPPAPKAPSDKPKKSKPGFFAKLWGGINKVGHYIATSRIATGLLLGLAAGLMVTGFGAAPGLIITAAVLGAGIGLAAGPLSNGGPSKPLQPPAPIASSPNSEGILATTSPQPTPKDTFGLNKQKTMAYGNAIGNQLAQNKSDSALSQSGPSAVVTPNQTPSKKTAGNSKMRKPSIHHKAAPKNHAAKQEKPKSSLPKKTSYVKDMLKGSAIVGVAGGILGAMTGGLPGAAIGSAAGAVIGAAIAAGRDYLTNKESSSKKTQLSTKNSANDKNNPAPSKPALPPSKSPMPPGSPAS